MTAKWCTFCPRRSFTYPGATTQPPKPDKDRPSALPRQAAICRRPAAASAHLKGSAANCLLGACLCVACNALPQSLLLLIIHPATSPSKAKYVRGWASVPRVGCHALVCRRPAGIFGRADHGHQAHMRRVHQLRGQVQGGGSSPFPATHFTTCLLASWHIEFLARHNKLCACVYTHQA
jgi:hypothetical protein